MKNDISLAQKTYLTMKPEGQKKTQKYLYQNSCCRCFMPCPKFIFNLIYNNSINTMYVHKYISYHLWWKGQALTDNSPMPLKEVHTLPRWTAPPKGSEPTTTTLKLHKGWCGTKSPQVAQQQSLMTSPKGLLGNNATFAPAVPKSTPSSVTLKRARFTRG